MTGKKIFVALVCAGLIIAASPAFAQAAAGSSTEEDDFFGTGPVEVKPGESEVKDLAEQLDREQVGLSGNLQASSSYTATREFFKGDADWNDNLLSHMIYGDFLIDIRLKKGFRAFVDINLGYITNGAPMVHNYTVISSPDGWLPGSALIVTDEATTLFGIKEIFFDFNIVNVVNFRAGKQVLQWGRGYLWNPTDMINVERKSFMDLEALREGVFGLRTDVIFAREFRLYTFLDLNSVEQVSDVAFSARAEALINTFEFGVSTWLKNEKIPVFGADFSTPLFWDINMTGEAAFSWGSNADKMDTDGSVYSVRDELVPKIAIGLSRSFDVGDEDAKIMANAEVFYNGAGYDDNMFGELSPFDLVDFYTGYYESGNYGKFYGALFITVNEFIRNDMTLTLSGMGNFSDMSFIAMVNLSMEPVNNFTLNFSVTAYLGPDEREYTISFNQDAMAIYNNMLTAGLGARVVF